MRACSRPKPRSSPSRPQLKAVEAQTKTAEVESKQILLQARERAELEARKASSEALDRNQGAGSSPRSP